MVERLCTRLAVVALLIAGVACKGPVVSSPLTGQTRYLCCNLRFEKPEITDNPYQVGTLVPFGTRVQILEVRTNAVKFQPDGFPPITLVEKYGKRELPFDTLMSRMFVDTNPRDELARSARPTSRARRGKRGAPPPPETPNPIELVGKGVAQPGMTKQEVIMALGYPPANRTPSLDAPEWHYWRNRWDQYTVVFENDRVARVNN